MSTEQTAQVNKQIERIHKIFESQLSICLDNLESTYEEFRQFDEAKANDTSIKEKYENALKMYKRVEAFETALVYDITRLHICHLYKKLINLTLKTLKIKIFNFLKLNLFQLKTYTRSCYG